MFRSIYNWFCRLLRLKRESYFVAVREGRDLSRVEELPSGKLVFYVDVTDVPSKHVEQFLMRAKEDIKGKQLVAANPLSDIKPL